jgi:elongation factor Ts
MFSSPPSTTKLLHLFQLSKPITTTTTPTTILLPNSTTKGHHHHVFIKINHHSTTNVNINANAIRALREATGAGLSDCKDALLKLPNDPIAYLKEKNKSVAQSKSNRITNAGLVSALVDHSKGMGVMVKAACETDFVARNELFQNKLRDITSNILQGQEIKLGNEAFVDISGQIRENLVVKDIIKVVNNNNNNSSSSSSSTNKLSVIGMYIHNTLSPNVGSIASLVVLVDTTFRKTMNYNDQELISKANSLAQHVVATNPPYINRDQVPKNIVEEETKKILSDPSMGNKPENVKMKAKEGKMNKFFADLCLLDQSFILGNDEGKSIKEFLGNDLIVSEIHRLQVK